MNYLHFALVLILCGACSGGGGSSSTPVSPPAPTVAVPPTPPAQPASNTLQEEELDIVYGTGLVTNSSVNLQLDLYQPSETCTEPRPFVIGIHGGGFTSGSRSVTPWVDNMRAVADRGFAGLSISYRLVGDSPVVSAEFQPVLDDFNRLADQHNLGQRQRDQLNAAVAAFEDTVTAIEWARENADERCLDPSRFALWGSSAGAITALHVAHALDDYFIDRPTPSVVVDYWGSLFLEGYIDADGPPIFILHGTADTTQVYTQTAVPLATEAEAAGLPFTFYTVENGPHGFGTADPSRVQINGQDPVDVTLDFIAAHLQGGTPLYEVQTVTRTP